MSEWLEKVIYQETFKGRSEKLVDEQANKFRERKDVIGVHTQTHVVIESGVPLFITIILYKKK